MNKIKDIIGIFDENLKKQILSLDENILKNVVEIRVRSQRKLEIITDVDSLFLNSDYTTTNDINKIIEKCCKYSLYSFQKDIDKGFITLKGGHRVGVVGKFIEKENKDFTISNISSINIRISKEVLNCSSNIFNLILKNQDANILLCGPPLTGKTTILRDISRLLSDVKNKKVSIIDERDEIANSIFSENQHYVGKKVDVLSSYPKDVGIITAIRTMSPQYIICDEIGSDYEIEMLKGVMNTGCNIIATIHSGSSHKRNILHNIISENVFDYLVFLDSEPSIGTVKKIMKIN